MQPSEMGVTFPGSPSGALAMLSALSPLPCAPQQPPLSLAVPRVGTELQHGPVPTAVP